jgi:hypothetical protein
MRGEDTRIPDPIRQKCADLTAMLNREDGFADKFFEGMVRKMRAERGTPW